MTVSKTTHRKRKAAVTVVRPDVQATEPEDDDGAYDEHNRKRPKPISLACGYTYLGHGILKRA